MFGKFSEDYARQAFGRLTAEASLHAATRMPARMNARISPISARAATTETVERDGYDGEAGDRDDAIRRARDRGEKNEEVGGKSDEHEDEDDAGVEVLSSREKATRVVKLVREMGGNICAHTTPYERKVLRSATCPVGTVVPRQAYVDPPNALMATFVVAFFAGIIVSQAAAGEHGGRVYGNTSALTRIPCRNTIDRLLAPLRDR